MPEESDSWLMQARVQRLGRDTGAQRARAHAAEAGGLVATDDYRQALAHAGFGEVVYEDLSAEWAPILRARLEMYRSLREETVARFGEAHYKRYDRNYAFFVRLVEARKLGGARLYATVPAHQ